jgi:hypothetical protein
MAEVTRLKVHLQNESVLKSKRRGVSKGVEDSHRPPALRAGHPEMAVRPMEGLPACRAWKGTA